MSIFSSAKPIRAGQGHNVTGIRGGGGIVPQKILTDEGMKRSSILKGNPTFKFLESAIVNHLDDVINSPVQPSFNASVISFSPTNSSFSLSTTDDDLNL